jgi:hypothetical protein
MYKKVTGAFERKIQQDCLRTKAISDDKNYNSNIYVDGLGASNETDAIDRECRRQG